MKAINVILEKCLALKSRESCLILTDGTPERKEIAELLFKRAKKITSNMRYMQISPLKTNGEEPDSNIAKEMQTFDVIIIVTAKSLSHTKARSSATSIGARIASMPSITTDILRRAVDVNYDKMRKRTAIVADALDKAKKIQIKTEIGTDITFSVAGRKAHGRDAGIFAESGAWGNLPDGEAFIAPVEGTAEGIYVVDASQAGIGKIDTPIWIKVKNGYAYDIDNQEMQKMLSQIGKDAFNIAEFGIGTNNKAKVTGVVLEDEKVYGTCHIALGNNSSFGGNVNVPIHVDGVMKKPTIYIDDNIIMEKGKLKI